VVIMILLSILGYIFVKGVGSMSVSFIFDMPKNNWREGEYFPAILGSLIVVAIGHSLRRPCRHWDCSISHRVPEG